MASSLDLQEQEQLDQLKAFWGRHGSLLTWLVTLVLLGFAGYNGWNWWQRDQGLKASALQAELQRAALAGELSRVETALVDLKSRFPSTAQSAHGALIAAKVLIEKDRVEPAMAALQWVAESAPDPGLKTLARLRWGSALLDQGKPQDALAVLDLARSAGFDPLVEDRRADALLALNRTEEAQQALRAAYKAMPPELDYRRVIEAKLMSLGVDPAEVVPPAPAKGAADAVGKSAGAGSAVGETT